MWTFASLTLVLLALSLPGCGCGARLWCLLLLRAIVAMRGVPFRRRCAFNSALSLSRACDFVAQRMGFPANDRHFRHVTLNAEYQFSPTYPRLLVSECVLLHCSWRALAAC